MRTSINAIIILPVLCFMRRRYCWAQSSLSFCDGQDRFVINEDDCSGGVNFGDRKPDCVCISGVYRSWSETCGLFDGFTHHYCSPLWDADDKSYNVKGLRLISGIVNVHRDTRAMFSDNTSDHPSWKAYGPGQNGKTKSDAFYTLNGFPVVLSKSNDKFFCVEPGERSGKQVCRYLAKDNIGLWTGGESVRIVVMDDCEVKGYTMSELKVHRCYDIINHNASECRLTCEGGRILHIPGKQDPRNNMAVEETENEFDTSGGGESMISQRYNATNVATQIVNNVNFFMHRKLNTYTRLRQCGRVARPDLSQTAPRRTFLLLETAKEIVREFCPAQFVSDLFLDQAVDLFVLLHRGLDYRYFEDVPKRDFQWIQDLLLTCQKERSRQQREDWFSGGSTEDLCENEDFISNYKISSGNVSRSFCLDRGNYHENGKYHFVIDAVWLMVDLIHVLCHSTFVESFRMFHVWEQSSEKLFTRQIRTLWFDPKVELAVYSALLSGRALLDMVNLERCVEGAYKLHPGIPELVRLPPPPRMLFLRRKRSIFKNRLESVASSVDVFCAKKDDSAFKC